MPRNGPIINPATDITTIAGKLNFHAIHCDPMPNAPINIITNKRDISIRISPFPTHIFNFLLGIENIVIIIQLKVKRKIYHNILIEYSKNAVFFSENRNYAYCILMKYSFILLENKVIILIWIMNIHLFFHCNLLAYINKDFIEIST